MASFSYTKLTDDLEYYAKAYDPFISRVHYGVSPAEWGASFSESDDVKALLAGLDPQEPLRILGVGSGTGEHRAVF